MCFARLIEEFEQRARASRSAGELFAHAEAAARELGFRQLAIVHGMAFRRPDGGLIRMDNFGTWAEVFIARRYYLDDPALLAAQRTNRPFAWTDIKRIIPLSRRQRTILREAGHHGLRNGFTVPFGVLGEPAGCGSFACSTPVLPPQPVCRAAAWIASEAFAEARRLHGFPARVPPMPHLSPRRLECLRWAAIGKTDPEIAIIMGAGEPTIRTYMSDLRRAFGVYSRTQLAREALRFGLVGLEDAIP